MNATDNYSVLRRIINRELKAISSTFGTLYDDYLRGDKIDMTLHFNDKHLSFFCDDFRTSFIENSSGDAFYDLRIKITRQSSSENCKKVFTSSIVDHVKIFQRRLELDKGDKDLPWVRKVFGTSDFVEDLFLIVFKNGRRLMIAFHPFRTGIEAYFTNKSIMEFWDEYRELYSLKYEIR